MPTELNSYPPAGKSTHEYVVALTGKEYILRLQWFDRPAAWYVDLYQPDGTPLAEGVRVVIGWDIWKRAQSPDMPPGRLIPVPIDGPYEDPTVMDSLGVTTALMYYEADEDITSGDASTDPIITVP